MSGLSIAIGGAMLAGIVLAVWLAFRSARKRGEAEAERDQFETTADILQGQRDALADRPDSSNPDDVLDRL